MHARTVIQISIQVKGILVREPKWDQKSPGDF